MIERVAPIAIVLCLCACGGLPEVVTDTGYQGTWARGNDRVESRLAIVRHEGEYLVRLSKIAEDGTTKIRCGWDGKCEEFVEGMKTSDLQFRVWIDDERGNLRIECKGQVHEPEPLEIHYIDELLVNDKRKTLQVWRVLDQNGEYEFRKGPRKTLKKLSDYVDDPPEGWKPPSAG